MLHIQFAVFTHPLENQERKQTYRIHRIDVLIEILTVEALRRQMILGLLFFHGECQIKHVRNNVVIVGEFVHRR